MDFEPYLGEIAIAGFNFAPRGWALCDGQLMPIQQNTALFSLLGVTYGGNGQTTFALPDLRGRLPVHTGQGPGLSRYDLGQQTGVESVTLNAVEMPAHSHQLTATGTADRASPEGGVLAPAPTRAFRTLGGGGTFAFATLPAAGGSQAHENRQPFLAMSYCIALEGIYPSRP